ncbi:hypothetical protein N7475_000010 [Penicillium sp. IBT 31633x]|nr:hypothetical protein N7475_000010 [Penicillium sp. IBT 31633x]
MIFPSPSTETTSLPIACSLLFFVLPWSVISARPAIGARSQKNQSPTRTRKLESDSGEDDIITATFSDLERGDAIYKTDLTELEDNLTLELGVSYNARELYKDPLDKGGVNLSKIPDDFDKAPGIIKRRERIKSRWKRYIATGGVNGEIPNLERGEDGRYIKGINKAREKVLSRLLTTTFTLPEIVYGPSLVICPHILLFGILFHARAKGYKQLLVPLDLKKSERYIFYKTELVKGVLTI